VGGDVGDVVRLLDHPVRTDEVCVTAGVLGVLLARIAGDLVLRADRAVDVAQEAVREVLFLGKGKVLLRGVERRAEDDGVELFEAMGLVTKALTLNRSTRRGGLGVPPQQHPFTGEVAETYRFAVLVGQFEVRGFRSWAEHAVIVAAD
jgi:hypothetical protein